MCLTYKTLIATYLICAGDQLQAKTQAWHWTFVGIPFNTGHDEGLFDSLFESLERPSLNTWV